MTLYRVEIECSELTPPRRSVLVRAISSVAALTHALTSLGSHCPARLSVRVEPSAGIGQFTEISAEVKRLDDVCTYCGKTRNEHFDREHMGHVDD